MKKEINNSGRREIKWKKGNQEKRNERERERSSYCCTFAFASYHSSRTSLYLVPYSSTNPTD